VGTLFVRGPDGVSRPHIALATEVEILVSGLVARTWVTQRFVNDGQEWVEGVYVFPLPEMAAVDRMALQVGERRIEGRIQERAQAKRTYQAARSQGRTASLLEQERPNLFTTSVANIGPGEPVEVTIEYQQTLAYESGGFELRFPMTLTARYVPGAPGGEEPLPPERLTAPGGTGWAKATDLAPDAARITPPLLPPGTSRLNPLRLHLELDSGFPLDTITSPSHALETNPLEGFRHEVWLDDVPADRDFVLRWAPKPGHEPRAAIFSEERHGDHYALLMVLPPQTEQAAPPLPREAILVIDTSGSMGGASIQQARAALHLALDRLGPDDTFNVIAFSDAPRALFDASQSADPRTLRRAHDFVSRLEAGGGTEMGAALERALSGAAPEGTRLRQVVFITDGSIGNEAGLFTAIQQRLGRSRLFMVGIGSAPNSYFLSRAAGFGRGTATTIGDLAEVRERMEGLFRKIENPVLSDLEIHWNDEVEMWPERVPDLYAGEPVLVTTKLRRFVGEVRLTGRRGGRPFEVALPLTPGAGESGIHKLWARRKIAHWMAQGTAGLPAERVREEVLSVALEHELVSKFTSLVAVDVTPRRPLHERLASGAVPNHGPAGFDPNLVPGVLLPRGATPAPLLVWLGCGLLVLAGVVSGRGWRRNG
jgi:Ca-activated chloride channel family protein